MNYLSIEMVTLLRGVKMIKILVWFLLILFLLAVFCEMIRIVDYQIIPYIKWKVKIVRERFRKKDSQ